MRVVNDGVTVEDLIAAVKTAVLRAGVSSGSDRSDLRIVSVQLVLTTVATASTGGTIDFRVPLLGVKLTATGKLGRRHTHTIDITIQPPQGPVRKAVRGQAEVEQSLVSAIGTIRRVIASAGAGQDPWMVSESSVELKFAVTQEGGISLGVDRDSKSDVSQVLRLRLTPR
jgi:hypothetical protein